jgi:hypothetical protein
VDFFALYIIPTDDWYIMPYAVMGTRNRTLHLTPNDEQKYGEYQEAWHLLREASKGRASGLVEIQASGDPAEAARAVGSDAVRKMFRGVFQF